MAVSRTHSGCGNYVRRQSLEQWDMGRDFEHAIQITCTRPGNHHSSQLTCIVLSEEIAQEIGMIKIDLMLGVEPSLGAYCASNEVASSTTDARIQDEKKTLDLQPQIDVVKFGIIVVAGLCLVLTCMTRARN